MKLTELWNQDLDEEDYGPPKTNRASMIGYECIRRLYFERINPEMKALFPFEAKKRMKEGKIQEESVRFNLMKHKFELTRGQERFSIPELQLTGKIEGFLKRFDYPETLFEIKTTEKYSFEKLNSIEDFKSNKYFERYLQQVTVYMKAVNVDRVLFIVKDRSKWDIKEFEYQLDEDIWEWVKFKCLTVNESIELNLIPDDKCCADFSECQGCPFLTFCQPNKITINEGFELIDNPELIDKLKRWEELKPLAKEYEQIDSEIKTPFKTTGKNAFIGTDYQITTKLVEKKGNDNPKPIKPTKYYLVNILNLNKAEVD